jgi:hypothetical protein
MRPALVKMLGLGTICLGIAACFGGEVPPPPPVQLQAAVDCQGIPAGTCQEIVTDARRNAEPGTIPVAIKAVCTSPPCTPQSGEVQVEVQYSNGSGQAFSMGWAEAEPGEAPVPGGFPDDGGLEGDPVCQGVPAEPCREMAATPAGDDLDGREIQSITVRCRAVPCTTTTGSGDTIVMFADGTSVVTDWSYENPAPPS